MSIKFRIFIFGTAITFIIVAALTFNSYFAKVFGFQPIQFNDFKENNVVQIKSVDSSLKTILYFDKSKNKLFLKNNSNVSIISNKVFDKILSIQIPKVRRETVFEKIFESSLLGDSFFDFEIKSDNEKTIQIKFFENSDKEKLTIRLLEVVPIGSKKEENFYLAEIDKNSDFYKILKLIHNINRGS